MIFYCSKCRSQYQSPRGVPHLPLCPHCKPFHATGPPKTERPPRKKRTPKPKA